MKKTTKQLLLIVPVLIVLGLGFSILFGLRLGTECGHWNFFSASQKECQCLGIKTGGCSAFSACDGASYYCLGICGECVCSRRIDNKSELEEISCDNECEMHGGDCYGFGDFAAETCEDHGMKTLAYNCPVKITLNTQCCAK